MRRVLLPNGLDVWAFNEFEAKVLYREIVTAGTYARHGITLDPGACVFDVGANIGLYALSLAQAIPNARIRCFEPLPPTFTVLQKNLEEHAPGVTAVPVGLAAAAAEADFEFDRYSTITASMHPTVFADANPNRAPLFKWASAGLGDFQRVSPSPVVPPLKAALDRPWSRPLALALLAPFIAGMAVRKQIFLRQHRCALRPLSEELAASGFERLDLVKIDVEGAEEEVLSGIAEADWPRIRQLVIEVHDVGGRIERMAALLRRRGFSVTLDREDWELHELMAIFTLYAARR